MAQTGFTPIQLYSTSTAAAAPVAGNLTNSTLGSELAINITDGKLFYKDNTNAVQVIGWKTVPTTAGGTGLTTYTAGDLSYYASGTTLTKLGIGASTTILTSTGSAPQWSATSGITVGTATNLAGGTAGSVPYQSGAGASTFLGIGAADTVLTSSGSAPQWSTLLTLSGNVTAAALIPSSNTIPTNGMYLLAANTLAFATNSGNAITIGSTGNVGIGTGSAPNSRLTVSGNFSKNTGDEDTWGIRIRDNTAMAAGVGGGITFTGSYTSGGGQAAFAAIDGAKENGTTGSILGNLRLSTTNSSGILVQRATFDSSGNFNLANGNVVIATSGKGIDFSATAGTGTSELLADYEEGTWTPTITCGTSGTITLDANENELTYTKIGRVVYISGQFAVSSVASPTGTAIINNLPFALATLAERAEGCSISLYFFNTTTNVPTWFATSGTSGATTLTVRGKDNTGALINATAATYFAAGDYILSGFYLTD